jgi:hypothetical protein
VRSPASWMARNAGAGLRRLLAAWVERESGRSCVKCGGGRALGTGEALRRELSAWACVVAEKSGDVRECALAGPRRGGGSDRAGPRRREGKGDARGNDSATGEPGPRGRERGGARE